MHNPKMKVRKQFHFYNIKKNKILRNKFNRKHVKIIYPKL